MKKLVAIIGLGLLAFPLLRHFTVEPQFDGSGSSVEVVSTLLGVSSGFMAGFAGLMVLGFLVDGGGGYRKPALLILMAALGSLWSAFYPCGWLLGIPLIVYPLLRRFGLGARTTQKEEQ